MDEEFMKELEQLTETMQKEMAKENTNTKPSEVVDVSNKTTHFGDFNMPFISADNEEDYIKELQKLLNSTDLQVDENDPETKQMMKMLGTVC
jgi:hypothetical protein